jgi:uncharacterized protein YbjT (DUF2867 family)
MAVITGASGKLGRRVLLELLKSVPADALDGAEKGLLISSSAVGR